MHFGRNQLLPDSIGFWCSKLALKLLNSIPNSKFKIATNRQSYFRISPLTPSHPKGLYHNWYRASTPLSRSFTLLRARSSGFGSLSRDCPHFHTMRLVACAHIAFAAASLKEVSLATRKNSLPRFSKRTTGWSALASSVNRLTIAIWFHALFSTFYGCFSAFRHRTNTLSDFGSV